MIEPPTCQEINVDTQSSCMALDQCSKKSQASKQIGSYLQEITRDYFHLLVIKLNPSLSLPIIFNFVPVLVTLIHFMPGLPGVVINLMESFFVCQEKCKRQKIPG